ncbi:MAG: hypothetical protein Q4Q25_04545 [Methanocorpusculum sp.]|nr:hypothetical protein [Methanocorpusculum sp.]
MDIPYLHDFHAAIEAIKASQHDVIEMVTKWAEFFNSDAKDITFRFANGDEKTVPNLEKVLETINERTLPQRPTFAEVTAGEKVRVTSQYGESNLTNGELSFSAHTGNSVDLRMKYGANGQGGHSLELDASHKDVDINTFPFYRYFHIKTAGATVSFHLNGSGITPNASYFEDFYVWVENGASVTFYGQHPGGHHVELTETGVYHMICEYKDIPRAYVSVSFRKLGFSNG